MSGNVNALEVIRFFYPEDTPLRRLLLKHSEQVRGKALEILRNLPASLNPDKMLVSEGALLHDIGIFRCRAPGIFCEGTAPYIAHGVLGAEMLRRYASERGLDLEKFARICERHTGAGITAAEIAEQGLPIPERDYLPETPEEKIICFADKFFSKSGDMREKSLEEIRHSLQKFGPATLRRFDEFRRLFG